MLLTNLDYTLPLNIFMDANFYPMCENSAPFHISALIKEREIVRATVADSTGYVVFFINISFTNTGNVCVGVGEQDGRYCGSCLCSKDSVDFFDSIPSIVDVAPDSLIFSAEAVRPIPVNNLPTGHVKYKGAVVKDIQWGEHLEGGTIVTDIIEIDNGRDNPIHTVVLNGQIMTGNHLFITPAKQGVIRVTNSSDISIGRLTDL